MQAPVKNADGTYTYAGKVITKRNEYFELKQLEYEKIENPTDLDKLKLEWTQDINQVRKIMHSKDVNNEEALHALEYAVDRGADIYEEHGSVSAKYYVQGCLGIELGKLVFNDLEKKLNKKEEKQI